MKRLEDDWDVAVSKVREWTHREPAPVPPIPTTQENTVTTPQQPHVADSLHAITGEIQGNPLLVRLLDAGLGKALTDSQSGSLAGLVAAIEREQAQQQRNAAIVAQIWARLQQSDEALSAGWLRSLITGQPGDAQQQAQ